MCILSRKHLSVPPGLGQRQQSLSLTFSVFFSAARSQVLPPFFFSLVKNVQIPRLHPEVTFLIIGVSYYPPRSSDPPTAPIIRHCLYTLALVSHAFKGTFVYTLVNYITSQSPIFSCTKPPSMLSCAEIETKKLASGRVVLQ